MSEALAAFLSEVEYPPSDPRSVIAAAAVLLAQAMDRSPSGAIAHELRGHLDWLGERPNEDPNIVDEIRAKRAQRRVQEIIRNQDEGAFPPSRRRDA